MSHTRNETVVDTAGVDDVPEEHGECQKLCS